MTDSVSKSGEQAQSYGSHRKFVPLYHFVLLPFLAFLVLRGAWVLLRNPGFDGVLQLLSAFALIMVALYARTFPLKVQDRLIRLEMRLRLQETLPEELGKRADELSPNQLVGLRFASSEELPDLVGRILAGELKGREDIKKAIRSWRGDHFRC